LDFGLSIPDDSLFLRVLREAKKTDHLTGRSYLYQAYETSNGIFDHLHQGMLDDTPEIDPDEKRPLSSVAMHFAEDTSSTSMLYQRIRVFKDRKVYALMGLNLTEFLELPRDLCDFILSECSKHQDRESTATEEVLLDLNRPR
jgi:hypothetical protein